MNIILLLLILICFGAMGFLYYRFCKKSSDKVLNILKNERKTRSERR